MLRVGFVGAAAAGLMGALGINRVFNNLSTALSDRVIFRDGFVLAAEKVSYYGKWVRANPAESLKWASFRDAIVAGQNPEPPVMQTYYGAMLVSAGQMALDESTEPLPIPPLVLFPSLTLFPSEVP
jgi:hypothetical protein